eukprot:2081306-Pleurochrysis_carterae.AAC.2
MLDLQCDRPVHQQQHEARLETMKASKTNRHQPWPRRELKMLSMIPAAHQYHVGEVAGPKIEHTSKKPQRIRHE